VSNEIAIVTKSFGKELTQNLAIAVVASVTIVLTQRLVAEISDTIEYRRMKRRNRKTAK
jgi:hypothetical protein